MTIDELRAGLDEAALGRTLHACVTDLYPLCRSLTGEGLRETLRRVQRRIPLTLHEVPTGTRRVRLDGAQGVEHPRRLREERDGASA